MNYVEYIDEVFNDKFTHKYKYNVELIRLVIDSFYSGKTTITAQDCLDNGIYDIYFKKLDLCIDTNSENVSLYYSLYDRNLYFEINLPTEFTYYDLQKSIAYLINFSYDEGCHANLDLKFQTFQKEDFCSLIDYSKNIKRPRNHLNITINSYSHLDEYVEKIMDSNDTFWNDFKKMASNMKNEEKNYLHHIKSNFTFGGNYHRALEDAYYGDDLVQTKYWETFLKTFYTCIFLRDTIIESTNRIPYKDYFIIY